MAETPGNDPKPTGAKPAETKPEAKSGAVKPPVLDLKARETGAGTSANKPDAKPADTAATTKPKPTEKPATATAPPRPGFPVAATLAGGMLGLAAAYGLAWFGLWPATPVQAPPADPRLASFATAIPELETVTQTTQAELATLTQRIGALETAEPAAAATAAEPVDLSTIEADIAALSQRIDSVSAPAADSGLDPLRADLAALNARMDELAARLGTTEAGLRDLDATVTETTAALASQPNDIGAVLQLPLILSGFETAFTTGRPYETELSALRAAAPAAEIPTAIANNAATGLTRPDIIASRFAEVLPAMLAGRPVDATAQWQDGALDWFRSVIALRPTGEIEGDNPEAVMSRLEGAVARRDFTSAETLLSSLPPPMLAAGGDVPALIATQAEAARFLDALRASALSGEAMQ